MASFDELWNSAAPAKAPSFDDLWSKAAPHPAQADIDVAQRIIAAQPDTASRVQAITELQNLGYLPEPLRKRELARYGYSMPSKPMQAINAFAKGTGSLVDTVRSAPVISALPIIGQSPREALKAQEAAELALPSEGFTDTAGRAIGSALPFAAAGLVGGPPAMAALGAASGMGQVRQDIAQVEDRTGVMVPWYEAAPAIALGGAVEGATEFAGGKILGGMGTRLGKNLAGSLIGQTGTALAGASVSNAAEEAAAQVGYNAIANIYDPEGRNLGEGVGQAALGGAIAGPAMSVVAIPAAAQARQQANLDSARAAYYGDAKGNVPADAPPVMPGNVRLPAREGAILKWLQQATGANVQLVRTYAPDGGLNTADNGAYDPKTNTFYINVAKPNVLGVLFHEGAHAMAPEFRQAFKASFPQLHQWGVAEAQRRGETENLDEEGVTYAMERLGTDPQLAAQVAAQSPGAWQQMRAGLDSFMDTIAGGNRSKRRVLREQMALIDQMAGAAGRMGQQIDAEADQAFQQDTEQEATLRAAQARQQGIEQDMAADEAATAQRQADIRRGVEQEVAADERFDAEFDKAQQEMDAEQAMREQPQREREPAEPIVSASVMQPSPMPMALPSPEQAGQWRVQSGTARKPTAGERKSGKPRTVVMPPSYRRPLVTEPTYPDPRQAILNPQPIEGQGGMAPEEIAPSGKQSSPVAEQTTPNAVAFPAGEKATQAPSPVAPPPAPVVAANPVQQTPGEGTEPAVMTYDEYSESVGVSRTPPSFPQYHRKPGGASKPSERAASRRIMQANAEWQEQRKRVRAEYDAKVAAGEIRQPTRTESLEATAQGEGEAAEAAKRLLAKRQARMQQTPAPGAPVHPSSVDTPAQGQPAPAPSQAPAAAKGAAARTDDQRPRLSRDANNVYRQQMRERLGDLRAMDDAKVEIRNLTVDVRELEAQLRTAKDPEAIKGLQKSLIQTIRNTLPDNEDRARLLTAVANTQTLSTYATALNRVKEVYADSAVRRAAREANDMVKGGLDARIDPLTATIRLRRTKPDLAAMTPEERDAYQKQVVEQARKRMLAREIDLTKLPSADRDAVGKELRFLAYLRRQMLKATDPEQKMLLADRVAAGVKSVKTMAAELLGQRQAVVAGKVVELEEVAKKGASHLIGKPPTRFQKSVVSKLWRTHYNPRTLIANLFGEDSEVYKLLVEHVEQARTNKHRHDMQRAQELGEQLTAHLGIKPHSIELWKYLNDKTKITLSGGEIELSRGDAATLWGMWTDPQVRRRFEGGEFVRLDDEGTITGKMTFTVKDIATLEKAGLITDADKNFVEAVKDSIHKEAADLMDAKLNISGWAPDIRRDYFPTERKVMSRAELPSGWAGMAKHLENQGFFEERTFSDKNPYVIRDIVSVLAKYNHAAGEVMYRAEAIRALNAVVENEDFKRAVENTYGDTAVKALQGYVEDAAGVVRRPASVPEKLMKYLTKNYGRALIALNKNVAILNTVAGPVATLPMFEMQDWNYGVRHMFDRDVRERMMKHPDLWARYNGEMYSHITLLTGETIPSIATLEWKDAVKLKKLGQAAETFPMMKWADANPMAQIVASAEHWAQRTMPDATEADRAAAIEAKVRDVMLATQNGGSASEISRWASIFRQNPLLMPFVMFTSDQNKKVNLLARAVIKGDKQFAAKVAGATLASSLIYAGVAPLGDKMIAELFRLLFGGETPPDENEKLLAKGKRRLISGTAGLTYFGDKLANYVDAIINERQPDLGSPVAAGEALIDAGQTINNLVKAVTEADPEKQAQRWGQFRAAAYRLSASGRLAAGDPTVPVSRELVNAVNATRWSLDDIREAETKELVKDARALSKAARYRKQAAMLQDDDPAKARRYLEYADQLNEESDMTDEELARARRYASIQRQIAAIKAKRSRGIIPASVAEARIRRYEAMMR